MLQNRSSVIFALVCCILVNYTYSQNIHKDIELISEKMETSTSVNLEVDVKVYSKKGGELIYSSKASAFKMGEAQSKTVLADMEFIQTTDFELKIDHDEKAILIFNKKHTNSSKNESFEFDLNKLKDLFNTNENKSPSVKLLSNVSNIKKYSITGIPGTKEILITLDVSHLKIISVIYEYGTAKEPGQYILLNYTKFDFNTDLSSHFDLKKYFSIVSGEYVLNAKFKDYHLYTEK